MSATDVTGFPQEECQRRLAGLRALMASERIDAVLLTTESNHRYFTGHVTHRWSHKYVGIFALLPREGEPVLIVTPAEAGMCAEDSWIENIRTFPPAHDRQGVDAIVAAIRDLKLDRSRIGAELGGIDWMRLPSEDFGQIRSSFPHAKFVDASKLMWKMRARKSAAEVDLVRRAVSITDQAYEVLFSQIKPGMTERDIYQLLAVEHLNRGAELPGSITIAPYIPGSNRVCDRTLRRPSDRVLTSGELITQDAGGLYRGYWSDYTRMYALGRAAVAHRDLYRIVHECLQAAIEVARAGVSIRDLVRASNAVLRKYGHADYAANVTGIGHAMGLDIIEPPLIALDSDVMLEEGMILTVEPGLFDEGAFLMLEEDVLVTNRAVEVLSAPAPAELPIL